MILSGSWNRPRERSSTRRVGHVEIRHGSLAEQAGRSHDPDKITHPWIVKIFQHGEEGSHSSIVPNWRMDAKHCLTVQCRLSFAIQFPVINLRQLTLARAAKVLIEDASLQIHPGQKIGLIGANGSGKSSLFALFLGELHAEAGDMNIPPGWVIAHVAQETPALQQAALEFALDGDTVLRQIERDLVAAGAADDGHLVGELHGRLSEVDGYGARARAAELLH